MNELGSFGGVLFSFSRHLLDVCMLLISTFILWSSERTVPSHASEWCRVMYIIYMCIYMYMSVHDNDVGLTTAEYSVCLLCQ